MLGSLGQRYGVIAFGSLLIAAYTMLGHNLFADNYTLPCFLLLGALWYNLVSLIESIVQPIRTTQQTLANCFIKLSFYLDAKAAMFDPDETDGFKRQTLELTTCNTQVINVFNDAKRSLFNRLKGFRGQGYIRKMLSYYFVAQDIHAAKKQQQLCVYNDHWQDNYSLPLECLEVSVLLSDYLHQKVNMTDYVQLILLY